MSSAHTPVAHSDPSPFAWVVARAALSDDAKAVGADTTDPDALLTRLLDTGLPIDAVSLLAAALPPREGIWWGWAAATHATNAKGEEAVTPDARASLAATEQWIANPDDAHRRAAWAAAQKAGLDTPAGCIAGAPFLTGGSIGPAELSTVIPPPAGIHAKLVAGTVMMSAVSTDPAHLAALAGAYVAQGREVLKQLGGWDASIKLARQHHEAMHEQHERMKAQSAPQPTTPPAPQGATR